MAGVVFLVCVPTKEHEALSSNIALDKKLSREEWKTGSVGNLVEAKDSNNILSTPIICRSKSDENIASADKRRIKKNDKSKDMFIGPWRVDASELPSRSGTRSSSARVGSKSDPDEVHVKPETPPREGEGFCKGKRHIFLETQLEKILRKLKVNNATWSRCRSGKYYQVLFSVENGEPCEEALKLFSERGIGFLLNSLVGVIPCTLYYQGSEKAGCVSLDGSPASVFVHDEEFVLNKSPVQQRKRTYQDAYGEQSQMSENSQEQPQAPRGHQGAQSRTRTDQGAWERFVQSVRARLTVAQVVEGVRADATFTFDFLLLLIVAALVAALGLLENSTVILVASMLISPLMGPVMAATFGTTIRDRNLQRMGLVNEFAGLLLSLAIGFLLGLMIGFLDRSWPTEEMLDRGQLRSLWVNVLIAMLSGAGISIALLRDHTGSLVGVAISASLLPPAVNAGLLWAMSLVYAVSGDISEDGVEEIPQSTSYYSENPAIELAVMGGVSLCLTFINIVFIFITGILMLKVKEVAPRSQSQHFWRHDVRIARDYNTTLFGSGAAQLLRPSVNKQEEPPAESNRGRGLSPVLDQLVGLSEIVNQQRLMCPMHHQLTWSPSTRALGGVGHALQSLYHPQRAKHVSQSHRRFTVNHSVPNQWRLGSSDGSLLLPLSSARLARASASAMGTTPYEDMLGPLPGPGCDGENGLAVGNEHTPTLHTGTCSGSPSPFFFQPRGSEDSANKKTFLSVANETELPDDRRPAKRRRFVVTKADDSELLIPTP